MDRRSWPWKKKSSDKADKIASASEASTGSQGEHKQDNYKKPNYVQISVESYSKLTGLEDQIKAYEERVKSFEEQVQSYDEQVQSCDEQVQTQDDQIKDLTEKLSEAQAEITTKDNMVKQHTKVAEEAVSGWEKAEAEALALKTHLESVTLSKLTVEDRASHLDGALKECMRQVRNLKEEHEQKLQDVALTKAKQLEKIRIEFEAKMADMDQELHRAAAENSALSRSLQERSNMLIKISEEKSQAEAEIELLKSNIESCEREINSHKYELHVNSKELEIRNEEKNMSMRSADAANKQHSEGVKKIAKLEAECQRLRGLVRKKLPGPAALAQMKLEVESLGRDYGDTRLRRSPVKPPSPHLPQVTDFSLDHVHKFHKENEFLTERLLATEEETKMLKEALAKRNSELQASRNLCAKTASRLQSLEAQTQQQQKNTLRSSVHIPNEVYSSQNASNPPSLTSMSEDGNEDANSCADSWATTLTSNLSQAKKDRCVDKLSKAENVNRLELMDDFLEMEKLACLPNDLNSNASIDISDCSNIIRLETVKSSCSQESFSGNGCKGADSEKIGDLDPSPLTNHASSSKDLPLESPKAEDQLPVINLQSRISMVLESMSKDVVTGEKLEDVKCALKDINDFLSQQRVSFVSKKVLHCSEGPCNGQRYLEDTDSNTEKEITVSQDSKAATEIAQFISQDLGVAISQIHDFVVLVGAEAKEVHDIFSDANGLSKKIEEFSVTFNKVLCSDITVVDFIFDLSHVLSKASELRFNILGFKGNEVEIHSPDCIDKIALPEDKIMQQNSSSGESYLNGQTHNSNPTADPEVLDDGTAVSGYEEVTETSKFTEEQFEELRFEKEKLAGDLSRCNEDLEITRSQLHETEQALTEVKSQLASAQKSYSLAETQLKCMAESYRSLETRSSALENEVDTLQLKVESLEKELQDEITTHDDVLFRCKELEEQLQRNESCSVCSAAAELDVKTKQEKELTAAAEKLAECQETIFLLGKQLKAMHPQAEYTGSPINEKIEDEPSISGGGGGGGSGGGGGYMVYEEQGETETTATSGNVHKIEAESPNRYNNSPISPSEAEANFLLRSPINPRHSKHRSTKSSSSTSLSLTPTPEKHTRGISRFFSSKPKNGH